MASDRETDAALLERFALRRDEDAFGALVERHGPVVLRACRRVLKNEQDVEDVYQATFVVLAHKARDVCWEPSIGGWLHSAAFRLALHARARDTTRRHRQQPLAAALWGHRQPSVDPRTEVERRDLRHLLDLALDGLPEKYRAPVVLCYLEGKTNEEAARQLGWPTGSMSRRLERARSLLRRRLLGRTILGIAVVAAGLLLARVRLQPSEPAAAVRVHAVALTGSPAYDLIAAGSPIARAREQAATFARNAERLAWELGEHEPRVSRLDWLFESARMRRAAGELCDAVAREDRLAMLSAARKLDTTCVRCHDLFHR